MMSLMEVLFSGVIFLILLMVFSRASFAWIFAALLVVSSGLRIVILFNIPDEYLLFCILQLASGLLMASGLMLRRVAKGSFSLFMRARFRGTTDFSSGELEQLMLFTESFRGVVVKVAAILCVIAALVVFFSGYIENDRSAAYLSVAVAQQDFTMENNMHQHGLKVVYPVLFPLLVGLIIAEFLLYFQDSSWFRNAPAALMKNRNRNLPSYYWAFPAMIMVLIWFRQLFALLATL